MGSVHTKTLQTFNLSRAHLLSLTTASIHSQRLASNQTTHSNFYWRRMSASICEPTAVRSMMTCATTSSSLSLPLFSRGSSTSLASWGLHLSTGYSKLARRWPSKTEQWSIKQSISWIDTMKSFHIACPRRTFNSLRSPPCSSHQRTWRLSHLTSRPASKISATTSTRRQPSFKRSQR